MSRQKYLTRRVKSKVLDVLCVDVESQEMFNHTATVPRDLKTKDKMLKAVRPMIETDNVKVVDIVGIEEVERTYRLKEEDFLAHAEEITK